MILGVRHTGIVVQHLTASVKFWLDMGLDLVSVANEPTPHTDALMGLQNSSVTVAKLTASDGTMIELLKFKSHSGSEKWEGQPYSTGITHVALTVDKLDGGVISPDGKVKVAYVRGPDNVILELVEEL